MFFYSKSLLAALLQMKTSESRLLPPAALEELLLPLLTIQKELAPPTKRHRYLQTTKWTMNKRQNYTTFNKTRI